MRLSIRVGSYVMWPLMIGLMVMSAPVVTLIYSEKWLPCVPFMQIACLQYALEPVQTANVQAVKALGKGRTYLIMEIVKKTFGIVMILLVMYRGVMAIAWTAFVVTLFAAIVNSTPNRKYLKYSFKEQLADLVPSIILASIMGGCVYLVGLLPIPLIASIILQVLVGAAVYILLSYLLKISQFTYILQVLKNFYRSFRKGRKKA